MADAKPQAAPAGATGVLVLADGTVAWGRGFGAEGQAVGEVCFHTAMTGYQEIMTDPSFAGQIITFTFPHIGNVGTNAEDVEADQPHALGMIVREDVTAPSNFRSAERLDTWMKAHARIGLAGIDTRALTRRIRTGGAPNGVIAHSASGEFDIDLLLQMAREWPGLEGMDLAKTVSTEMDYGWQGGIWRLGFGYEVEVPLPLAGGARGGHVKDDTQAETSPPPIPPASGRGETAHPHVVAIDYGSKRNIFRNLVKAGAKVSVVPATATYDQIMALAPDGFFLSNGPGDPAATAEYAVPVIQKLLETGKPLFGICLGHQLLGLAVGARTTKMFQGHRGANHPVKRLSDGAVEITSMNHGFAVERDSLPEGVRETHVSLFDGSNAGLELTDRQAFSVQYHPEASPGPQDSLYLFERFVGMLEERMYEAGKATRVAGCLVVVVGLLAVATCAMRSFFDVSSNQSAAACNAIMRDRILAKVAALPPDAVLKAKDVIVEHDLRGNRDQTEPLARLLLAQGKSVRIDSLEVGTQLVIQDRPESFREHAPARIDAICRFAAHHHLQYDSWWVSGERFSEYVSQ